MYEKRVTNEVAKYTKFVWRFKIAKKNLRFSSLLVRLINIVKIIFRYTNYINPFLICNSILYRNKMNV